MISTNKKRFSNLRCIFLIDKIKHTYVGYSDKVKGKEFEIIEEYIDGNILRDVMNLFTAPNEIFRLLSLLVTGLSLIWDKNIIHRDLKPENIIIRPTGMPCIIDLGIARFLDLEALTKTISPMGPCTPIYASPEQLTNNKNLIDSRSDYFNLGIIALELYLSVHPFDPTYVKNHFSTVENILQSKYILETDIIKKDENIAEFVNKTLQFQPYKRFRNYTLLNNFISKFK